MHKRKTVSLVAVITAAMVVRALAAAQPWPEAHSGAYLGVQISTVSPQQVSTLKLPDATGALITYVDQDGPACRAGLLENDVVVAYEGSKIESPQQLQGLIHATPPQKTITLTVVRSGQRKDIKVTLGSWNIMSHAVVAPAITLAQPPPPRVYVPDIEIPSFTLLSSRHGLVVESLSPQLADFFGVAHGLGVLVRSVESGSPAAAAGLKAGDIILKINNDAVHDMADWQRGMRAFGTRLSIGIWRDKREQTVMMAVPGPADNSRLTPNDWLDLGTSAQLLREQIEQMQPQIDAAQQQLAADMHKMSRELAESARPSAKDMEKMRSQIQKSMPSPEEFAEMTRQVQASVPTRQQMDEMRRQIDEAMKTWTPQLQEQMEELRKQMEQQKLDLQKMLHEHSDEDEF